MTAGTPTTKIPQRSLPSFWQRIAEKKKTIGAISFIVLLFAVYYNQLLSGSKFLWEDYMEQAYPNVCFAAECIRHGTLPLWTPHIFGGMPYASDPQSTLFYPPFWLYLLFSLFTQPGGIVYTWYILLHILVLGIGTFFMMRGMELRRSAAVVSAVTLMFAGFVSLHVFHTFVYVVAWFPFAFHFLRKALSCHSLRKAAAGGLFLGMSTLGGYPQYSMFIIYFCAAWTFFSWLRLGRPQLQPTLRYAGYFAVFAGIGIALAAVQYLPSFENMAQSVRETMTFEESVKGAMSIPRLSTLLSPSFFGMVAPAKQGFVPFWGMQGMTWGFWETCIFVGILPLFLSLRAVIDGKRDVQALFFLGVAGVSVLLALGAATPLYSLVFHWVPGFKSFRIPGRFSFLFAVCITILAGIGIQRLLTDGAVERKRFFKAASIFAGSIIALCLLYFAGFFSAGSEYLHMDNIKTGADNAVGGTIVTTIIIWAAVAYSTFKPVKGWMGFVAAGVIFVELFAFGSSFAVANSNPRQYYGRFDLTPLKKEYASSRFRIQGRLYRGEGAGEMLFPRNLGNVSGLSFVDGYNQLRLSRWNDLMWKVDEKKGQSLFNIRYIKVPGEYRLKSVEAAPRFYLSTHVTTVDSRNAVITVMNDAAFVPGRDVVLEKQPNIPFSHGTSVTGTITVVKENNNRIELDVTASQNGILSASELFYPAWKATVDGKSTEVLAANCAFRAIPVTKGSHRVVMYYQSDAMQKGAVVSLTALAGALLLLFAGKLRGLKKDKKVPV